MESGVPSISVYMSVHNAEPYLDACLSSILGQSEPDLEFLVIDDGSTDGSHGALQRWARRDVRIRVIDCDRRLGLIASLNRAAGEARAPLCARMDADDISHPDRLWRQRQVLDADPSVALVGALSEEIDVEGRRLRPRDRWRLLRSSPIPPFAHPTVMFRRTLFNQVGGYRNVTWLWEDVDLCHRLAAHGRIMIVPETLYFYRIYAHSTTLRHSDDQTEVAFDLMSDATPRPGPRPNAATLYYVSASRLWAGQTPAVVGGIREVGRLPLSGATLKVLTLATWGRWSPSSLRSALRLWIRLRDAVAGLWLRDGAAVEWHFE